MAFLFLPLSVLTTAIWLLILPIVMHLEIRFDVFSIKGTLSIVVALVINFVLGYELYTHDADVILSPDFAGVVPSRLVEFSLTRLNLTTAFFSSVLFTAIIFYSWKYMRWETLLDDNGTYKLYYYFLMFTSFMGFQVIVFSNDAFLLFFGWEMMVVPGYALVAIRPTRHAARASYSYAIISSIGSIFMLYGISMIYQLTGTFNLDIAATMIASADLSRDFSAWFAIVMITIGVGVTAGFIGFQTWIPDAYSAATSPVGGFVSGTFTIAALFAYNNLILRLFSPVVFDYSWLFIVGGLATMTVGNFGAIVQRDVRRILGYSSIGQRGYVLFGFGLVSLATSAGTDLLGLTEPMVVVIYFTIGFTFLEGNLFLIIGKVLYVAQFEVNSRDIIDLRGSLSNTPHTAMMMILSALGLAGIPPTIGFSTKIMLLFIAGESGVDWWLILLFLLNSIIALIYYSNLLRILLFTKREDPLDMSISPGTVNTAIFLVSIICILLGLAPNVIISMF